MNATITLKEYLEKRKTFVIPNYQRGYVWGKKKSGETKDSVTYILEDTLIRGFREKSQIFVQGITVCEKENEIILIDGQQRTTFFYLLLKYLGYSEPFTMKYDIRKESNEFLSSLNSTTDYTENTDEEFQDIYFFKKTLRIINEKLSEYSDEEKENFKTYILENIKFLYIDVPEDKAVKVFTMMNGNKAQMKSEELIKAELLRLASLNDADFDKKEEQEKNSIEWDNNMLRSRYAREWDKWLQWWNRDDVKKLYKHSNVMGYLISTYLHTAKKENLTFSDFKNQFLSNQKPIEAKQTFDGLRRLQKRFEDAFNNPVVYNKVGAILRIFNNDNMDKFIQWYFAGEGKPNNEELDRYYRLSFIGLTNDEITNKNDTDKNEKNPIEEKFIAMYQILDGNNLYYDNKEEAFRLLLRLNIDEDNKQESNKGRKFDFSIWDGNRSLEHIYPKSKVWHKETDAVGNTIIKTGDNENHEDSNFDSTYIERDFCVVNIDGEDVVASEHSIGNLVLLYGSNNSSFGNKTFEEKKRTFFDPSEKSIFESRHLLHTIYKFATSEWNGESIAKSKHQILKDFVAYYNKLRNENYGE